MTERNASSLRSDSPAVAARPRLPAVPQTTNATSAPLANGNGSPVRVASAQPTPIATAIANAR